MEKAFFHKSVEKSGTILHDTCLLQYHIAKENCEEVKFEVTTYTWQQEIQKEAILSHKEEYHESN